MPLWRSRSWSVSRQMAKKKCSFGETDLHTRWTLKLNSSWFCWWGKGLYFKDNAIVAEEQPARRHTHTHLRLVYRQAKTQAICLCQNAPSIELGQVSGSSLTGRGVGGSNCSFFQSNVFMATCNVRQYSAVQSDGVTANHNSTTTNRSDTKKKTRRNKKFSSKKQTIQA